ncbi:hypothetical protein DPMN_037225 [Dreissena polymorpha]|uniref:Uncharacterized protein n=1 Tax=Dreissena polymorpha TaxID=45954 RepID=A0A9D4ME36_DREPO|nr:hypothetical protein DPMN_037225 [Dreissena polymorpha]
MSLALGIRGHLPKFSQSDYTCSSVLFRCICPFHKSRTCFTCGVQGGYGSRRRAVFTHVPLNSLVVNEHLLNKLLAFSIEQRAEEFTRKLKLLHLKFFPCDLTVAGLRH